MPDERPTTPGLDALSRYEALLSVSRAIARHTSVAELLRAISDQLHLVVPFDYLMLILHDAPTDEMRLVVLEPSDTPFAPFVPMPLSDWGPARSAWDTQRTSVVPLQTEARSGTELDFIREHGARVTCWLPLTTAHRRVGVLSFGSRDADQYGADAVAFMEQVAAHVAIAVDNAINFDDAQRLQGELREERDRLRLLLEMNNLLVSRLEYPELLQTLSESLQRVVKHDSASVALVDGESGQLRLQALTYHDARGVLEPAHPAVARRVTSRRDVREWSCHGLPQGRSRSVRRRRRTGAPARGLAVDLLRAARHAARQPGHVERRERRSRGVHRRTNSSC